jgi:hypothetical protein
VATSEGIRARSPNGLVVAIGLVVVAVYLFFLFYLMDNSTYDSWGAMLIGPVLFAATLPALARQARREGNPRLFWFLVAALSAKMLFSLLRWYHAFNVIESADARGYDRIGTQVAERFLSGNFDSGLESLLETNFIRLFTGIIYTVIRPSVIAGFLIYAWLAFWGMFYFYRAFVTAIPEGNHRSYARWLFFTPSILFWPSSIGKESFLMFGLGIAAFGIAKLLTQRVVPGLVIAAIGLGLAALVRAPIAVVMGLGLVVGGILRRPSRQLGQLGPVAKVLSFALLAGVVFILAGTMQDYLARSGYGSSIDTALSESSRVTSTGGSEFSPATLTSPQGVVMVVGTILFRPFLWEVGSADAAIEAAVAAIEATILLIVCAWRFRSFGAAFRSIRKTPYVAVAIVYIAGSIVGLSTVANFGIIARQRTLLYPMLFVLMCFQRKRTRAAREGVRMSTVSSAVRRSRVSSGAPA